MRPDSLFPNRSYDPAAYGEGCADFYDALYPGMEPGLLDTLQELSGAGPALEFGVATGRVAIPLAERGITVHGIDASSAMLERLKQKPGADLLRCFFGDFSDLVLPERYRLIFALVNTLHLLPTVSAQARCFANAARHLLPGGRLLIEGFEPVARMQSFDHAHRLWVDGHDRHYRVHGLNTPLDGQDRFAEAAGLTLIARWRDWRRQEWRAGDTHYLSVYQRAA